jgi:glycosyltransferase involved in cell wall biosynthesis
MKVCLVTRRMPPAQCGVADYTLGLASALGGAHDVVVVTGTQPEIVATSGVRILPVIPTWGPRGMVTLVRTLRNLKPDCVVIEYVPFLYAQRGVNFWLPLAICWMRLAGVRVLLTVHEPFVEIDSFKHALVGIPQRAMLWLLIRGSQKVAVTASRWADLITPYAGSTPVFHLPVASNLPCVGMTPDERRRIRAELGVADTDIVVATLRPTGAGKPLDLMMDLWRKLRKKHERACLLVLGLTDSERHQVEGVGGVLDVGYVRPELASQLLSSSDVFIAPFVDGVSTRRTSVMAALAHGLPVVSTRGWLTDSIYAASPLALRAPDDVDGLLADLDGLVQSAQSRRECGDASRRFYAQHFDWPVLTGRFNDELREPA